MERTVYRKQEINQYTFIIEQIPIAFDLEPIKCKLDISHNEGNALELLVRLAKEAANRARPKAAFKMCSLDVLNKDQVQIEGVTFTSSLRQQLTGRSRIFPYLITEGTELAEWSLSLDLLDQIFVYTLREAIVGQYRSLLEKKILEQYGISQISAMNPGSLEAWPLSEQAQFFQLMAPVSESLGITLLTSMLMKPEFSVSGIFFQTDTKYYNCQLCPRAHCSNRKAPSTVV